MQVMDIIKCGIYSFYVQLNLTVGFLRHCTQYPYYFIRQLYCCHLLSFHVINMVHSAVRPLVWRSVNGKWRTLVLDKGKVSDLIYACVCVCVCVGTIKCVFIYRTQKGNWLRDLMKKAGTIFLQRVFAKFWNSKRTQRSTWPFLQHIGQLLTWQQLTVWQLKLGEV